MSKIESNIDWKTCGLMAGIALGVFIVGTVALRTVIDPMIEDQQAKQKAKAKKSTPSQA